MYNVTPIHTPKPFSLQLLSPKFKAVVIAGAIKTHTKKELALACALGAIAFSCQRNIKVSVESNRPMSTALSIFGIALSGEGKTALDGIYMAAPRNFELKKRLNHPERVRQYKTDLAIFRAQEKAIEKQLRIDAEKNGGNRQEELGKELFDLLETRPEPPVIFQCIFENTTPAALVKGLVANACVAVMSHEGANAIKGGIFADPGLFNSGYDGAQYHVARAGSGHFVLPQVLITLFILIQPKTFARFMEKKGDLLRDIGLINRSLLLRPESCIGYREFIPLGNPEVVEKTLAEFQHRSYELMEQSYPDGGEPPELIIVVCSPEAQIAWEQYRREAEYLSQPTVAGGDPNTYMARTPQNVARIAALLGYFFEKETVISADSMNQAIAIVKWFADQYKEIFHPYEVPQEERDAMEMYAWLQGVCRDHPTLMRMEVNDVLQGGPLRLRKSHMCRPALQLLERRGMLSFFKQVTTQRNDKSRRYFTEYIDLSIIQNAVNRTPQPGNVVHPATQDPTDWVDSALNKQLVASIFQGR